MIQELDQILPPGKGEGSPHLFFEKKGKENGQEFRELLYRKEPSSGWDAHQKKCMSPHTSSCEQKKRKEIPPEEKRAEKDLSSSIQSKAKTEKEIQKTQDIENKESYTSSKDDERECQKEEPEPFAGIHPEQKIGDVDIKERTEAKNLAEMSKARLKIDPHEAFEDFKKENLQRNVIVQFERSLIPEERRTLSCETTLALMEKEPEELPLLLQEKTPFSQVPLGSVEKDEEKISDFSGLLTEGEEPLAEPSVMKKTSEEENGWFKSENDRAQEFQETSFDVETPSDGPPVSSKTVSHQAESVDIQKHLTPANSELSKEIQSTQGIAFQMKPKSFAGSDRIEIQLRPEHLGRLNVRLEISHDGRVQTIIKAEKIETYDLMRHDRLLQQDLVNALKDSGLEMDEGAMRFEYQEQKNDSREEKETHKTSGFNAMKEEEDAETSLQMNYLLRRADPARIVDSYI